MSQEISILTVLGRQLDFRKRYERHLNQLDKFLGDMDSRVSGPLKKIEEAAADKIQKVSNETCVMVAQVIHVLDEYEKASLQALTPAVLDNLRLQCQRLVSRQEDIQAQLKLSNEALIETPPESCFPVEPLPPNKPKDKTALEKLKEWFNEPTKDPVSVEPSPTCLLIVLERQMRLQRQIRVEHEVMTRMEQELQTTLKELKSQQQKMLDAFWRQYHQELSNLDKALGRLINAFEDNLNATDPGVVKLLQNVCLSFLADFNIQPMETTVGLPPNFDYHETLDTTYISNLPDDQNNRIKIEHRRGFLKNGKPFLKAVITLQRRKQENKHA